MIDNLTYLIQLFIDILLTIVSFIEVIDRSNYLGNKANSNSCYSTKCKIRTADLKYYWIRKSYKC